MDAANNISDILSSLMSNPKVSELISDMTAKIQSPPEVSQPAEPPKSTDESQSNEESGISIPPEILSSLPQIMSALSGMGIGSPPSDSVKHVTDKKEISKDGQRKALLHALKPYLSEKRCAVIDGLLQFESFSHILNALNSSK